MHSKKITISIVVYKPNLFVFSKVLSFLTNSSLVDIQSSLFIAIIIIYSSYNFNKSRTVDLFINTMNNTNLKYKQHKQTIKENYKNKLETMLKNENDIKEITFIPKQFNTNTNVFPEPYTKYDASNNQLNVVYKGTLPNTFITDTHYAQIMLNELYTTYNYKNINKTCLDKSLDNDSK